MTLEELEKAVAVLTDRVTTLESRPIPAVVDYDDPDRVVVDDGARALRDEWIDTVLKKYYHNEMPKDVTGAAIYTQRADGSQVLRDTFTDNNGVERYSDNYAPVPVDPRAPKVDRNTYTDNNGVERYADNNKPVEDGGLRVDNRPTYTDSNGVKRYRDNNQPVGDKSLWPGRADENGRTVERATYTDSNGVARYSDDNSRVVVV